MSCERPFLFGSFFSEILEQCVVFFTFDFILYVKMFLSIGVLTVIQFFFFFLWWDNTATNSLVSFTQCKKGFSL